MLGNNWPARCRQAQRYRISQPRYKCTCLPSLRCVVLIFRMLPDFSVSHLWCADAATPPTPIPAYCCCPFVLLLLLPDLSVFRTYVCRIFSPVATKRDYMSASRESSSNAPKKLFPRDLCLSLPLTLPQNAIMSAFRERVTSSCLSENHDKLTAVVVCA